MKKTIQINIAGVVFYIEEDAYAKLNNYLKSIQAYFANYEGSQEIIADIEARIAEKFLEKGSIDEQHIILNEDIDALIRSMGTVADFEALEEEGDFEAASRVENSNYSTTTTPPLASDRKRIYRDTKRKALGGVLSGMAHYFNIDVTWVRILFLLFFFGLSPITDTGASGILLIAYLVCWIAFPPNEKLEEDPKIKKFYRNPEGKVVGGVASGLAAYFGVDIAIVRLLFVVSGIFGAGIIAYIILWVAAPEAATLTQRMEMKGEPVTLENIESNVKRSLNVAEHAPENLLTKILLFPFRIIAMIIRGIGNLLKNLGPIIRILIGLFLLIFGGIFALAVIAATAAFFGVATSGAWLSSSHEFSMFTQDISPWAGFFGFLASFIPAITLALLGISLLTNRQVISRTYWLSGLGVWFIGLVGVASIGTTYSLNFARDATYEETQTFAMPEGTLYLDTQKMDNDGLRQDIRLRLTTNDANDLRLEKSFEASGPTRTLALENAQAINYTVVQRDSLLIFDQSTTLPEGTPFREQRLRMKLQIPAGKPFKMSPRFAQQSLADSWQFRKENSINLDDVDKFTFQMDNDDNITCLNCPVLSEDEREQLERDSDQENAIDGYAFESKPEGFSKTFDNQDFKHLDIGNAFYVTVRQGNQYSVEVIAEKERDLEDVEIKVDGNTLNVGFEDIFLSNRENVYLYITMPTLQDVDLSGAVQAKIIGFENLNKFNIAMSGASRAAIAVEAEKVTVDASGASRLDIRGKADEVDFDVNGASRISAQNMQINKANAEASGASRISFGRVNSLNSDTSGASKITRK